MKVDYSRENLMTLDPTTLRAMIVERTHHTVEIQLYDALAKMLFDEDWSRRQLAVQT